MTDGAAKRVLEYVEPATKIGIVTLGLLYVIGLLIVNAHLMKLGISDFAGLKARFVLIGLAFIVFWIGGLLTAAAAVWPIALFNVPAFRQWFLRRATWRGRCLIALGLVTGLVFTLGFVGAIVGAVAGRLSVQGLAPVQGFFTFKVPTRSELALPYIRFWEFYTTSSLVLTGVVAMGWTLFHAFSALVDHWDDTNGGNRIQHVGNAVLWALIAVVPMLPGYAVSVYPNMLYNFGGGQPQVIELHVPADEAHPMRMLGIQVYDAAAGAVTTPVAVWHQSEMFLYVSPLPPAESPGNTRPVLVAVALDRVKGMRYLPKYIVFGDGGTILAIHDRK